MTDNEKSREVLVAEVAALRRDLEEIRNPEKRELASDASVEAERCRILVSELPEYLYSIEFDKERIIAKFHSPRCEEITGYTPREYAANPYLWVEMIHEKDRERVLDFIQGLKEPLSCRSIEHRIVHKDGSVRWVVNMTTVHLDIRNLTLRQSGFLIDVTARREEEERNLLILNESRRNSLVDDLTGLYNRRGFRELAEQQLRIAARIGQAALLFFFDVNRLKQTNDTFGHGAGDELLVNLASILRCTFRESDLIARIGGDEFTVLTMETGPDSNELLVGRLHANIADHNCTASDERLVSVSIGVSRYDPRDSTTVTGLIDRADTNMYAMKKALSPMMEPR